MSYPHTEQTKLSVSSISFWAFVTGTVFSWIWIIVLFTCCMFVTIPNSSFFPEIDFASKCVESTDKPLSTANLLYPISNTSSGIVRKRLGGKRFFVNQDDG